jgi:hypothetical protein
MNRRDLLKSSATLAAAIAGCIPDTGKVAEPQAIRLSDDCHVDCQCSGYPPTRGCLIPFPSEDVDRFLAALKKGPIRGEPRQIVWKKLTD